MMSACVMLKQWKSLVVCSIGRAVTPVMLTTTSSMAWNVRVVPNITYEEWILFTVIFKQCLGQCKRSRNSAVLKALSIDKVQTIVNRNVLNVYHRIFKLIRQSCL